MISDNKCWWECEEIRALVHCWWEGKMVGPFWETVWHFLKILNIKFPYDPAVLPPDIYPREMKTCLHKNLYMNVHSSIIHNSHKVEPPKCLSTDIWVDKMCPYNGILFNHKGWSTVKCYSMAKPWKHCAKWSKPVRKRTYSMIPFIWSVQNR